MTAKIESIDDFDVDRMYNEEGMSQQEIADYYGVTQSCIYYRLHPDKIVPQHPDKRKESSKIYQQSKKGKDNAKRFQQSEKGKVYFNTYQQTGLQGLRHKIRTRDNRNKYIKWLRRGLIGDFNIHHEWIPETDNYTFSALVDASEHLHNIIKPIIILEDNRIKLLQDCDTYTKETSEQNLQKGSSVI